MLQFTLLRTSLFVPPRYRANPFPPLPRESLRVVDRAKFNAEVERGQRAAQGSRGADWSMIGDGAISVLGGAVSTVGGVFSIASGVAAPAGVAGVVLGIPTMGFGVANIIDGFAGGHSKLPSGPAVATDIGFGGDGTVGQIVDVFSGGLPKNVRDGLLFGYGIYSSNIGQAMFRPSFSPISSSPFIIQRDNTNVVMPRFPR
jgi:hypothetical protein